MASNELLITAAGGNGTAIRVLDQPLDRTRYAADGKLLGEQMEPLGAEQAGFLVTGQRHFEMAGGEFCGNATRAAALLFADIDHAPDVTFTVSGFDGTVTAHVERRDEATYQVRCVFPGMPTDRREADLADGQHVSIVDLGGIVHVGISGTMPKDYHAAHRAVAEELGLTHREAVGVVWFTRDGASVTIQPVVWVKDVDTFFYEQSCGSGTIAIGKITGATSVVQPTGKAIAVGFPEGAVVLESQMEVIPCPSDSTPRPGLT